jgi:hypothetical protein
MKNKRKYPDTRIKAIQDIINLIREEKDWKPEKITISMLKILNIAPSKESNTIFCLKFLGIIDDKGFPTNEFDNLRNNFKETLSKLVKISYSHLLEIIPPSRINQDTLLSFFTTAGYSVDTSEYQAKLFVELCNFAEIKFPNVEGTITRAHMRENTNEI